MKAEFLRPQFNGERFAEHTLPLEVARDLAAYETLVVELAKVVFRRENPTRQRVPKGFGDQFQLHLENLENGSTIPVLAVVDATTLPFDEGIHPYFERARDLIAECVAAPPNRLPEEFPREHLMYFNQLGRSLRPGESLTLSRDAVLTPQRRKELVLAASNVYEREIELNGTIGEADWEKSTFRLRMDDGNFAVIPMPESFHAKAREYGGRSRFGVTVKAVAAYDSWDKLQKVILVETLDIQPQYQLAAKFETLAAIENGWLEGQGKALESDPLALVAENFLEVYPETLPLPFITPTPEGNLLFEWDTPSQPSVDLELSTLHAEFHAFKVANNGITEDIERDFFLATGEDWSVFFAFLNQNVEPMGA